MQILCETTGPFQIVDYNQGAAVIHAHRPTVAVNSHFVSSRAALGQVRVLGNVSDDATDAEFQKYWGECDGDATLAVSSFLEAYGENASNKGTSPAVEKKTSRKGTKTSDTADKG